MLYAAEDSGYHSVIRRNDCAPVQGKHDPVFVLDRAGGCHDARGPLTSIGEITDERTVDYMSKSNPKGVMRV